MAAPKSMITGRRVKGTTTRRKHLDVWPKFDADDRSERVLALRERDRRILAVRLAIRGNCADIAAMLDLPEVTA